MYLWKLVLLFSVVIVRLPIASPRSAWALTLQVYFFHNLTHSCSPPEFPFTSYKGHRLSFSCLSSSQSSLFRQSGLLHQWVFWHMGMACSHAFNISLKNAQPSWIPLPFRNASQGTLSISLLNRLSLPFRSPRCQFCWPHLLASLWMEHSII